MGHRSPLLCRLSGVIVSIKFPLVNLNILQWNISVEHQNTLFYIHTSALLSRRLQPSAYWCAFITATNLSQDSLLSNIKTTKDKPRQIGFQQCQAISAITPPTTHLIPLPLSLYVIAICQQTHHQLLHLLCRPQPRNMVTINTPRYRNLACAQLLGWNITINHRFYANDASQSIQLSTSPAGEIKCIASHTHTHTDIHLLKSPILLHLITLESSMPGTNTSQKSHHHQAS
jgi:hypothetical protein